TSYSLLSMKFLVLAPLLLLGILLSSCKSRPVDPETYTKRIVKFGSGGGFTGFYTHYQLLENGDLFMQKDPDSTMQYLLRVKKKLRKPVFAQLDSIEIEAFAYDQPGNLSQYVETSFGERSVRSTFTAGDLNVPIPAKELYQSLIQLIPLDTAKP
ncbi:MAG: hypothetical protein AAGM67_10330, partial [Bacteroidota bacterium]